MYTCGPTVYRYAHVGNLRRYLLADLIRRVLLYHGLDVLHVKNITDVGHLRDERFDRARTGCSSRPVSSTRRRPRSPTPTRRRSTPTRRSSTSCRPTSSRGRPSTSPRCSALAEALEDAGSRLRVRRGQRLLRRRRSFPGYGRLSGNSLDDLRAGHRGEVEPDKRDPADFALWKAAGEGAP